MRFQIISDVHLEFYIRYPRIKKNPGVEIVCLLGDIGYPHEQNYRDFLIYLTRLFKAVIVIAGNHEYYNPYTTHDRVDDQIRRVVASVNRGLPPNRRVFFLRNQSVNINGVRFIGGTMWTQVKDVKDREMVGGGMNDYVMIKKSHPTNPRQKQPICVDDTNLWNSEFISYLVSELQRQPNTPTVVLTHHAPLTEGVIDPQRENRIDAAYTNDLRWLLRRPIRVWCYGHTHYPADLRYNGVQIVTNPLGYRDQHVYKPDQVLSIDR